MNEQYYIEGFPDWVLKILPVLTEHLSLKDFESWLYQPQSETYFPENVYIELISANYFKLSEFIDVMQKLFSFNSREIINSFVSFIRQPSMSGLPDFDDWLLLPVSNTLMEFIFDRIWEILYNRSLSNRNENPEELRLNSQLLDQYLERVIFLFRDYDKYKELDIRRELNKIFLSERINLLRGIK
ncbi:hypothetical protein ACWIUA_07830 [Ursidibacter sp. B-7004-1]